MTPVSISNVQPVEGGDVYEDDSNDNIHAYFASVELGSVDTSVSRKKSTINVITGNHNLKVKPIPEIVKKAPPENLSPIEILASYQTYPPVGMCKASHTIPKS